MLLYAHHDVQPEGDRELWTPRRSTRPNARAAVGRGTADDKAGIAAHAAALRVWRDLQGGPPVNVSVFIEGEEEIASQNLPAFLGRYGHLLEADAIILADCSNWRIGEPALTTSLRGILDFIVEVRTLDHAVHSGAFGGPVPDALLALCRLVASLHDEDGDMTVDGLKSGPPYGIDAHEAEIRQVRPAARGFAARQRVPGAPALGPARPWPCWAWTPRRSLRSRTS